MLGALALLLVILGWWATHQNTLKAQSEHLRNELRVKTYEELSALLDGAVSAGARAITACMLFPPTHLELFRQWGIVRQGEGQRIEEEMRTRLFDFLDRANQALIYVEHHRFLLGPLENMRLRIHLELARLREIGSSLHGQLAVELIGDGYQTDPEFPARVEGVLDDVIQLGHDINAYLHDLRVETERLLLGDLFEHRSPRRRPLDPSRETLHPGPAEPEWERLREYHRSTSGVDPGPYVGDTSDSEGGWN